MGKEYDEIKNFDLSLQIKFYKQFNDQIKLFEEMMELFLEPLNEVISNWQYKEENEPLVPVIVRMFNDFESSRLLLLNGFPEQAIMSMRDSIECMMLFRLFRGDSKYALRWIDYIKEYKASSIKTLLDSLKLDCPEYAFYGMFSEMAHPNILSVASKVTEYKQDDETTIRRFHLGGMNRASWTEIVFNHLLASMLMTLVSVLPPTYLTLMKKPDEWLSKVLSVRVKCKELRVKIESKGNEETTKEKIISERLYKKFKLSRIEAELERLDSHINLQG
jgi:hypothetical protein